MDSLINELNGQTVKTLHARARVLGLDTTVKKAQLIIYLVEAIERARTMRAAPITADNRPR